jgi:hypothetical protein
VLSDSDFEADNAMDGMQVYVKNNGVSQRFFVRSKSTVQDLKALINFKLNIPMDIFFLSFAGKLLSDDVMYLTDYDIVNGSQIELTIRGFGGAPKKRQKSDASASFSFEEFINMGKPQILASDPIAVANALNIGTMTRKHFIFWLSTLSVTDLESLQETFQENSRTGNLKQMSVMIIPYVQEQKDIKFLEGRIQIAKSYMLAAMMQGVRDAQLSYSVILKLIQKTLKKKFSGGSMAASSVGSDEDDMDP